MSNYGGLALVFADAADQYPIWSEALQGWNKKRSRAVSQWLEEGRQEGQSLGQRLGQLEFLETALSSKFGPLSEAVRNLMQELPDERLKAFPALMFLASSLAELGIG